MDQGRDNPELDEKSWLDGKVERVEKSRRLELCKVRGEESERHIFRVERVEGVGG